MDETGRTCDPMPTTSISDALDFIPFDSTYSEGDINLLSIIIMRAKNTDRIHRAIMHLVTKLTNHKNCMFFFKQPHSGAVLECMKRVTMAEAVCRL